MFKLMDIPRKREKVRGREVVILRERKMKKQAEGE